LGPCFTFRSFWRFGWTFVSASMHRFKHATSASCEERQGEGKG
jgi:hypothetical protein